MTGTLAEIGDALKGLATMQSVWQPVEIRRCAADALSALHRLTTKVERLEAASQELDSLRNFMQQRRGRKVVMVSGAAIRTIEDFDAQVERMKLSRKADKLEKEIPASIIDDCCEFLGIKKGRWNNDVLLDAIKQLAGEAGSNF